ncbi:hypothetical protein [Sorangium sp. So ce124]|uniref:hypothetical protein n=1 Tax=Sorangium sp. So ce124 TaxID=3133280 RepID=UPI003F5DF990
MQLPNLPPAERSSLRTPGAPSRRCRLIPVFLLALAAAACGGGSRGDPDRTRDDGAGGNGAAGGNGGAGDQGGGAGSAGQGDARCHDYTRFDAGRPVEFRTEVLPLLQRSCATGAACHADSRGDPTRPYLGPTASTPPAQVGADELAAIREQNVDVDSAEASGMKRVAPGDPEHSYVMHKIDGTLECGLVSCDEGCGLAMPPTLKPLSADEKDTVRRWIAHGAAID